MKLLRKFRELRRRGYAHMFPKGILKHVYYRYLQKKYGFDAWHISPGELRPYAMDIIRYINSRANKKSVTAEIGCGLGEIIRNISGPELIGLDINKTVLEAAGHLDKAGKVRFVEGSFSALSGQSIDFLVAVNFTHGIPPEELKQKFIQVCSGNCIRHIIIDFVNGPEYTYSHGKDIIPEDYRAVEEFGGYAGGRKIIVFQKKP